MRSVERGDGCECDAAEVGHGVFVVSGGNAAPVLESVKASFDAVALSVDAGVEGRWPATLGAFGFAAGDLVAAFRDGVGDSGLPQRGAGRVVRVSLIGQQPKPAAALLVEAGQQRQQHGVVAGLAGREQQGYRCAAGIGEGVDLRGPAAAGPAKSMINGLAGQILVIR